MNALATQFRKELDTCSKCLKYLNSNNRNVNEAYHNEYEILIDLCIEAFYETTSRDHQKHLELSTNNL